MSFFAWAEMKSKRWNEKEDKNDNQSRVGVKKAMRIRGREGGGGGRRGGGRSIEVIVGN